jgi:hypothetical protein
MPALTASKLTRVKSHSSMSQLFSPTAPVGLITMLSQSSTEHLSYSNVFYHLFAPSPPAGCMLCQLFPLIAGY